jgi:hypothetical protein
MYTGRNGEELLDKDLLGETVYKELRDNHVASTKREIPQQSVTRSELFEIAFPKAPRLGSSTDVNERKALDTLASQVWQLAGVTARSVCNIKAWAEGFTYVLCETEVPRTYPPSFETRKAKSLQDVGRFFSDAPDLIMAFSVVPASRDE